MKLANRNSLLSSVPGLLAAALLLSLSQTANAQYLISTKAGFVNRVEGRVLIQREENQTGNRGRASLGTQMKEGDLLMTQSESRAEVLLTPGSYLRLYENSEIRAVRTGLTAPHFALLKGSVIVETAQLTKGTAIQIDTPNGPVSVGKEGIQRIDVTSSGTNVAVRQGEILLGTVDQLLEKYGTKIGKGKMVGLVGTNALSAGEQPVIAKLNKDASADDFDVWSFNRAQTLMAANSSALRRSSLSDSMSLGWYFDSSYNCYTYMPGRRMYFSPYGFPFFSRYSDYYYYFPYGYGYYGYQPYAGGGGGTYGGGGGGGSTPARVIAGHDRAPIGREMAAREMRTANTDSSFGTSERGISTGSSSSSGSVTAPSSAVSISAPASRGDSGGASSSAARPSRP